MPKPQTVVVDEGSNQIKVCWIDETGKINLKVVPAMIQKKAGTKVNGDKVDGSYKIEKTEYFVNPNILKPITTKRKTYQVSRENRVLVHEALRLAGFGGKKVDIICTLPVTQFYMNEGNVLDDELLAEKKKNLTGSIECMTDCEIAQIVGVTVAPESVPAWFDLQFSDEMEQDESLYEAKSVMVVDIGGTTTDVCVLDGTGMMQGKRTIDCGVYDIAKELKIKMIQNGIAKELPRTHMNEVLRSGTYQSKSVLNLIKEASEDLIDEVIDEMEEMVPHSGTLDHILYVGGGAALVGEELAERYGNKAKTHIPDNPDTVVARGLMKLNMISKEMA